MAKSKSIPLGDALKKVATTISGFAENLSDEEQVQFPDRSFSFFSHEQDAGLRLSDEEHQQYTECLDMLVRATNPNKISQKTLSDLLKQAILVSLDINKRRGEKTLEERTRDALQHLKTRILSDPHVYRVFYRVSGIKPTFLPSTFGNVEFTIFDDSQIAAMNQAAGNKSIEDNTLFGKLTVEHLEGKTVGVLEVPAFDVDAAKAQALKELQLTIDIINFYSDIVTAKGSAYAAIYGQDDRTLESIPVIKLGDKPRLIQTNQAFGRFQPLLLSELVHGKGTLVGAPQISTILTSKNRTEMEKRLLAAMQWAGRATVDTRLEEAFLLFAIALESLIMELSSEGELSYRLKMRVAHLVGAQSNTVVRQVIKDNISRLYSLRSAIVHKGEVQVDDQDVADIRLYAKECIVRILTKEPFTKMTKHQELVNWFDQQLLDIGFAVHQTEVPRRVDES